MTETKDAPGFYERLILVARAQAAQDDAEIAGQQVDAAETAFTRAYLGGRPPWAAAARAESAATHAKQASTAYREAGEALLHLAGLAGLGDQGNETRTTADWLWEPLTERFEGAWAKLSKEEQAEHMRQAEEQRASDPTGSAEPIVDGMIEAGIVAPDERENLVAWIADLLPPRIEAKLTYGALQQTLEELMQAYIDEREAAGAPRPER